MGHALATGYVAPQIKSLQPVLDAGNTKDGLYLQSWVADVSLVHKNGEDIQKFRAVEAVMRALRVSFFSSFSSEQLILNVIMRPPRRRVRP